MAKRQTKKTAAPEITGMQATVTEKGRIALSGLYFRHIITIHADLLETILDNADGLRALLAEYPNLPKYRDNEGTTQAAPAIDRWK